MTIRIIETGLPALGQPSRGRCRDTRTLYTAHGPVDGQGRIVGGPIEDQARLTLRDVAQVLIYLRSAKDVAVVDAVYREFFSEPSPNRSTVGGLDFVHPDMAIELVAYAALPG